jgi:hypothetical protein
MDIATALAVAAVSCGCSLILTPDRYRGGEIDAGARDGGLDSGPDGGCSPIDCPDDSGTDAAVEPPAAPTLTFPWNGYMTGSLHSGGVDSPVNALRPLFMWQADSSASEHEIEVASSCTAASRDTCTFAGAVMARVSTIAWRPDADLPVSMTVPVGRRYFWRVRSCNGAFCSPWSEVRYLEVGRLASDLNGDGYGDEVVGSPASDDRGSSGAGFSLWVPGPDLDLPGFPNDQHLMPDPQSGAFFGATLAFLGDVNGDGFSDLAVGGPGAAVGGSSAAGVVQIYHGSLNAPVFSVALQSSTPQMNGQFGTLAGIGDYDGDGYADVAVGASYEDFGGVNDVGRVFIFRGSSSGVVSTPSQVLVSPAPTAGAQFGFSVAGAGDTNADGFADLIVGAPNENGGSVAAGRAYCYFGGSAFPTTPSATLESPEPQMAGHFGQSISNGGDMNGDGYSDVALGASETAMGASLAGRAHLFAGSASGLVAVPVASLTAVTPMASENFARALSLGDATGDGLADVWVGAPQSDSAYFAPGSSSDFVGTVSRVACPDAGSSFGWSVSLAIDLDGDGVSEGFVGAPTGGSSGEGQLWIQRDLGGAGSLSLESIGDAPGVAFGNAVADR